MSVGDCRYVHNHGQFQWLIVQREALDDCFNSTDVQCSEQVFLSWVARYEEKELGFMGNELQTVGIFLDVRESCQAITRYQAVIK